MYAFVTNPEKFHIGKCKKNDAYQPTGELIGKRAMIHGRSRHSMEECKVLSDFGMNGSPSGHKKVKIR